MSPTTSSKRVQGEQVRLLISRGRTILCASLIAELSRAIVCCGIAKRMTGGSRQSSLSNGRRGNLGQVHETPFARKDLQIEDDSEINVALGGGTRRAPVYTDRLG